MDSEHQSSPRQMLIFSSLAVVLLLLLLFIFVFGSADPAGYKRIQLASGEWAPYTSATLPEFGVVSAVVTRVLGNMGYQSDYQFMPWASAENIASRDENSAGIRGAFPFINPDESTDTRSHRSQQFYFSDSLMEVRQAIFYDRRHNPNAALIERENQLSQHQVIRIDGYEYPAAVASFINYAPDIAVASDTAEAIEILTSNKQPLVVIEALEVGRQLIESKYPSLLPFIRVAPLQVEQSVHLMLGKRNPDNLAFKRKFDAELHAFREDKQAFQQFTASINRKIELATAVQLEPTGASQHIIAYLDAGKTKQVLLPKGSKAKVIHWPGEFLNPFPTKNEPQAALAQVKILNGPYAATQARLFIESAAIRLPDR